jgi:hypothetical protein
MSLRATEGAWQSPVSVTDILDFDIGWDLEVRIRDSFETGLPRNDKGNHSGLGPAGYYAVAFAQDIPM